VGCYQYDDAFEFTDTDYRDARFKAKKKDDFSSSESDDETADQKRKRLAEEHLDQLKQYGIVTHD
jgi:hypothetical protein